MEIKELITDKELQECLELVENTNHDREDIKIICKDCGKTFIFTVGEQQFYKSKNFAFPQRCRQCAKKRRKSFLNYR